MIARERFSARIGSSAEIFNSKLARQVAFSLTVMAIAFLLAGEAHADSDMDIKFYGGTDIHDGNVEGVNAKIEAQKGDTALDFTVDTDIGNGDTSDDILGKTTAKLGAKTQFNIGEGEAEVHAWGRTKVDLFGDDEIQNSVGAGATYTEENVHGGIDVTRELGNKEHTSGNAYVCAEHTLGTERSTFSGCASGHVTTNADRDTGKADAYVQWKHDGEAVDTECKLGGGVDAHTKEEHIKAGCTFRW